MAMEQSRRFFFSKSLKSVLGLTIGATLFSNESFSSAKNIKKARMIPTVRGEVSPADLGITLIHEHIFFGEVPADKEEESIKFAVDLLKEAERVGINTVVDLSPTRNIKLYEAVAHQVSINIIVSTGAYIQRLMPEWLTKMNKEQFKEHIHKELTKGIQGTNIRAGIIKVAGEKTPLTDWERMIFSAAAQVQKEHKVPIATHAIFNPGDQFDLLVSNGADAAKLFFSHTEARFGWGGQTREQMGEQLLRIAKGGGHMLFNNFGYEFDTPWEDLVYLIRLLCDSGLRDNVLTSIDLYWYWKDGKKIINVDNIHPETRERTYSYMITDTVPALLKAGFSANDVHAFLVDNPRTFFS